MVQKNQENRSSAAYTSGDTGYWWYRTLAGQCVKTSTTYSTAVACQANLYKYLNSKTTGICYTSVYQCQAATFQPCTAAEVYPKKQPTCVNSTTTKTCMYIDGSYVWTYGTCGSGSACVSGWCK